MRRHASAVLVCAALCIPPEPAISQGPELPDTPVGRRAAELLDAIRHSDDADSIRQFFATNVAPAFRDAFPMSAHIGQFRRMHASLGSTTITEVRPRGEHTLALEVQTSDGPMLELTVEVDPSPPHRIMAILLSSRSTDRSSSEREPGEGRALDAAVLVRRLASFVDSLVQAGKFSGVVLLAADTAILLHQAYGLADRTRRVPNTTETRFNLGSINKMFTAVAIRELAQRGTVDLDAPLGRYLPDYPNALARRLVTVRQLLEHRSGIEGNIFQAPAGGSIDSLRTIGDFLELFADSPLRFTPGERAEYSNAGYIVLGVIIERVSGSTYHDYVRQHVFEPLGMEHTGSYPKDALPPNTAIGYMSVEESGRSADTWRPNTPTLPGRGSSAGGGYSTSGDLLRVVRAAREGRLPGVGNMGIAGGAPGINATMEIGLPGGYDLIVLANIDPPAAERVGERVRQWLSSGLQQ